MKQKTISDLVAAGKLQAGTTLHHKGRTLKHVTATVSSTGIKVGRESYGTPSQAARSFTGKPVDGWFFWRLPDGRFLAAIR